MKIAIATNDYTHVAGHAGQARHWLLYDSDSATLEPQRIQLERSQVFHYGAVAPIRSEQMLLAIPLSGLTSPA